MKEKGSKLSELSQRVVDHRVAADEFRKKGEVGAAVIHDKLAAAAARGADCAARRRK